MPPFVIQSTRGGLNNTDPPIALADDQVVEAFNVEWVRSELGERRRGAIAIDTDIADPVEIFWIYRHLPDGDERNAQLWVWWRDALSYHLEYKDTSWHTITIGDALDTTSPYRYRIQGATLHGKLFIFYKSAVDRSHVFDVNTSTTALRRVGMAELSTAPTGANDAGAGTYATTRYFRTREIVQVSGSAYLRSEPSDVLTHAPPGNKAGVTVTKPSTVNTDPAATHWELEESIDNANFYRIATVAIGTTTYDDTNTAAQVTTNFPLSEDIGDYTPPGSYEFGVADADRLVMAKQYETEGASATVVWTPVANATGVGNDERIPLDPESTVSLENLTGGGIRAVSRAVAGEIWVGKNEHIYKLNRTGQLTRAYAATLVTSARGMVRGSAVEFVSPDGSPALFFCDPALGPCLVGRNGLQRCGQDIFATWKGVVLNAPIVARALFYAEANQIHLWVTWVDPDTSDRGVMTFGALTTLRLVLQVNEMRLTTEGWRRGWSIWDGDSAAIQSACLYSENIDDDTDRSVILRPFIATGVTGIWRTDTGDDDDGTAYEASEITKPYAVTNLQQEFEMKSAVLVAKAEDGATLTISAIPNGGVTTTKLGEDIDCSPDGDETFVIRVKDELSIAELRTLQVQFADTATAGSRWELARLSMTLTTGQEA